jgi:hypothetical protein
VYAGVVDQEPDFIFKDRFGHEDTECGPSKVYSIDKKYDRDAVEAVKEHLAKVGLRLARILEEDAR